MEVFSQKNLNAYFIQGDKFEVAVIGCASNQEAILTMTMLECNFILDKSILKSL